MAPLIYPLNPREVWRSMVETREMIQKWWIFPMFFHGDFTEGFSCCVWTGAYPHHWDTWPTQNLMGFWKPAIKWDPGRGLLPIALPWLKPKQYGKPLGIVPSIEISENLNGWGSDVIGSASWVPIPMDKETVEEILAPSYVAEWVYVYPGWGLWWIDLWLGLYL